MKPRPGFKSFLCDNPFCCRRAVRVVAIPPDCRIGEREHRDGRAEVCARHVSWALDIARLLAKVNA